MAIGQDRASSQLFVLRVWSEDLGDDQVEVRGTLKHILTGETQHFRTLAGLSQLLASYVPPLPESAQRKL